MRKICVIFSVEACEADIYRIAENITKNFYAWLRVSLAFFFLRRASLEAHRKTRALKSMRGNIQNFFAEPPPEARSINYGILSRNL
jgi:hypothetical protein